MTNKYLDILTQVVRHPRHPVDNAGGVRIELQRAQKSSGEGDAPQVVDFSRGGCRVQWESQLSKDEPVVLTITDVANGLALELPATVRWSKPLEDSRHESGVQFDNLVDYEHLGELFLAGFLSAEEAVA